MKAVVEYLDSEGPTLVNNFWHNYRSATDIVFTKSKVKPKTQIAQYAINELPFHQAHQ